MLEKLQRPELHYAFRLPEGRAAFSVKEVAAILEVSAGMIEAAIDSGKLMAHVFSGRAPRGQEVRMTRRVPRQALLLFLLHTASVPPESIVETLLGIIAQLPGEERAIIRRFLGR